MPNRKRLKFFVKDPIEWTGKYEMASFYKTLLTLRKTNPALAADASYKRLATANDHSVFAYTREKTGHKIAVILNLSKEPQSFTIKEAGVYGSPKNIFTGKVEKLDHFHLYKLAPWGYLVYEY